MSKKALYYLFVDMLTRCHANRVWRCQNDILKLIWEFIESNDNNLGFPE